MPDAKDRGHGTLTPRNVQHVPTTICHVISAPALKEYMIEDHKSKGTIRLHNDTAVGSFVPTKPNFEVRVSGPPVEPRVGHSPLDPTLMHSVAANRPTEKREQWPGASVSACGATVQHRPVGLSDKEKGWLKEHYGSEFYFLRDHGLSIYKEEDREDGRQVMRASMKHDVWEEDREDAGRSCALPRSMTWGKRTRMTCGERTRMTCGKRTRMTCGKRTRITYTL